jgi:Rad3-related DNA helicase/DNA polymerase III epsilon subunit-like protein
MIGIDLETTSLAPEEGDIIEVAAIRFDTETKEELGRFIRLVKPVQSQVSPQTTAITGITPEMVADKETWVEIREELREFIGEEVIFAHNASFDLAWLSAGGLELSNPVWDTFPLAAAAWPEAASYNLGALAMELGLKNEGEHRAGADVVMTWQVLQAARERLVVPTEIYRLIGEVLGKAGLGHLRPAFSESKKRQEVRSKGKKKLKIATIAITGQEKVEEILGETGWLKARQSDGQAQWPDFKYRAAQVEMAQIVQKTWQEGGKALIEAPTGIGKTYGYLVPALLESQQDRKVVVSTYTKHLQEQLEEKDVPQLLAWLGREEKVALLKGRSNYLCQESLQKVLASKKFTEKGAWLLIKVLVWQASQSLPDRQAGGGDLGRLNLSHQETSSWRRISAESLECKKREQHKCYYQAAWEEAQTAKIVIVNHSLLAQMALEEGLGRWLAGSLLVVDEAHHLPTVVRQAARTNLGQERVEEIVAYGRQINKQFEQGLQQMRRGYQQLLLAAAELLEAQAKDKFNLRLSPGVRQGRGWQYWSKQGAIWEGQVNFLVGLAEGLLQHLPRQNKNGVRLKKWIEESKKLSLSFYNFREGAQGRVQWIARGKQGLASLQDVPLRPESLLATLYERFKGVVLTSATLATAEGDFSFIKSNLGGEFTTYKLPAAFDYQKQMLIYVVNNAPAPTTSEFDKFTAQVLELLAKELRGKVLGLFTSHKALKNTYKMALEGLQTQKVSLLAQGLTGGRRRMLQKFSRGDKPTVLLGTLSFWEGVDIAGEALSAVLIPRLPWPVPTDPILEAIGEEERERNNNFFRAQLVPRMLLNLRQGMGRLIRSEKDKGVVVILDRRWQGSDYEPQLRASWPVGAQVVYGPAEKIPQMLQSWLGEETIKRWQEI